MAQNYIQPGEVLEVTAPAGGYASGAGVLVGLMVGISLGTYAQGDVAEVKLTGVFNVTKATGSAWAQGDKLYWDDTNKRFTKTATSNTAAGYAAAAALSADTTGQILLKQIA